MEQTVKVRRLLPDGMAEVMRIRESACSGDCHKCSGCGATQQTMLFEAKNAIGAKPGDLVVVESDTGTVLKGAAILYMVPLASFLICYILGETLWGRGVLMSVIGFFCGMLPIRLYDRYLAKKGTAYTIKSYAQE